MRLLWIVFSVCFAVFLGCVGPRFPSLREITEVDQESRDARTHVLLNVNAASLDELRIDESLVGALSEASVNRLASQIAVTYPKKPYTWCHKLFRDDAIDGSKGSNKIKQRKRQGIFLTKTPKAASSTSAGVVRRIAHAFDCEAIEARHKVVSKHFAHVDSQRSLMLATVRDPSSRSVSRVNFNTCMGRTYLETNSRERYFPKGKPFFTDYQLATVTAGQGGYQLRYLSLQEIPEYSAWNETSPDSVLDPRKVVERVVDILHTYDLIMVPERMDESLVALSVLLNIDVLHVLVMPSKVSGSGYCYNIKKNVCGVNEGGVVASNIRAYLQSDHWRALNYGDFLLHAAARYSLSQTISSIQPEFDRAMERYQTLKALVVDKCANETHPPCESEGEPNLKLAKKSCYYQDEGCGYACVNEQVARYDRMQNLEKVG